MGARVHHLEADADRRRDGDAGRTVDHVARGCATAHEREVACAAAVASARSACSSRAGPRRLGGLMSDVLDLAERLWNGEVTVETHHPVGGGSGGVVEVADGVAFWHGFSNSTIARTDAGLVMVDSGDPLLGRLLHEQVRGWQPD